LLLLSFLFPAAGFGLDKNCLSSSPNPNDTIFSHSCFFFKCFDEAKWFLKQGVGVDDKYS
jgi:hypothetical protein